VRFAFGDVDADSFVRSDFADELAAASALGASETRAARIALALGAASD
jgi:hypothetical protein